MFHESSARSAVVVRSSDGNGPGPFDAETLDALRDLHRDLTPRRTALQCRRRECRVRWETGELPSPDPTTRDLREDDWTVDRPYVGAERPIQVIVAPTGNEIEQALSALGAHGACVADLEDSLAPTWSNVLEAHARLRTALLALAESGPTLLCRPRGLHAVEPNVEVDGEPISASVLDVLLFAGAVAAVGAKVPVGVQVPKIENPVEARWWNELFRTTEEHLGLALGRLRVEVLVETLPAVHALDEILFELRERASGLAFGDRNYLFGLATCVGRHPGTCLPDVTNTSADEGPLAACARRIVRCAARRGVTSIGAPAAAALHGSRADLAARLAGDVRRSRRAQAELGFDGTALLHPSLVSLARDAFAGTGPADLLEEPHTAADPGEDLLAIVERPIAPAALRRHVHHGLHYLAAWLQGRGRLSEGAVVADASTAELARAQLWQWIEHRAPLTDGSRVTVPLVERMIAEERNGASESLGSERYAAERIALAAELFAWLATAPDPEESLTDVARVHLVRLRTRETKRAS